MDFFFPFGSFVSRLEPTRFKTNEWVQISFKQITATENCTLSLKKKKKEKQENGKKYPILSSLPEISVVSNTPNDCQSINSSTPFLAAVCRGIE